MSFEPLAPDPAAEIVGPDELAERPFILGVAAGFAHCPRQRSERNIGLLGDPLGNRRIIASPAVLVLELRQPPSIRHLETAELGLLHIVSALDRPCRWHSSVFTAPASAFFRMPMMCSLENCFRCICPSLPQGRTLAPTGGKKRGSRHTACNNIASASRRRQGSACATHRRSSKIRRQPHTFLCRRLLEGAELIQCWRTANGQSELLEAMIRPCDSPNTQCTSANVAHRVAFQSGHTTRFVHASDSRLHKNSRLDIKIKA